MSDPYGDAILDLIADGLADLRAVVPGVVETVALGAPPRELHVDFTPAIGRKQAGEDVADGPVPSVPILFPGGANFSFRWPLAAGDETLGLAVDRNPEAWRRDRLPGAAHSIERSHAVDNVFGLPVAITAPDSAPVDLGGDMVMSGGAGEAIRLDLTEGTLTLTKGGAAVATLTLTVEGDVDITPAPGRKVLAGGSDPIALNDPLVSAIDGVLADLVAAGAGPTYTGAAVAQTNWLAAKGAIASVVLKGS